MAPFRGPVFSQGRAWLPPWLASLSLECAAAACDTPSVFAMTGKDLDEISLNSNSTACVFKDVTNRSSLCLHLSEDKPIDTLSCQGVEEIELKNKALAANALGLSQPKALILQLSLSQTQTATDANLSCAVMAGPGMEGASNAGGGNLGNAAHQSQGGPLILGKENCVDETRSSNDEPVVPKNLGPASASLDTDVTELYEPPAQHSSQSKGKVGTSMRQNDPAHGKRTAEDLPSRVREGKKVKHRSSAVISKDVETAIGLAVATAEILVIADIMNGCEVCQTQGPKAILDAALLLKRGREASGLDRFTLGDLPCEVSPDSTWDEDLDDNALEAEFCGTFQDECKDGGVAPCDKASTPVGMLQAECPLKTELALAASKLVDNEIETNELEQLQSECERTYSVASGKMQKILHGLPVSNENGGMGVTSVGHGHAQAGVQNDFFSSRWLGGWTGANFQEHKQVVKGSQDCNQNAAQRLLRCHLKFETSELSESCQSLPQRGLGCSTKENKASMSDIQDGTHKAEALTAGSCAEILLALSQVSVKSSLQEPLCSFVPCSVNMRPKSSSAEEASSHGPGLLTDGGDCREVGAAAEATIPLPTFIPCDDQNVRGVQSEGVKWVYANSLLAYSTSPLSPLLEAIVQMSDKPNRLGLAEKEEVGLADKEEAPLFTNIKQMDMTAKGGGPLAEGIDSGTRLELILQDSGLQDSPPLIWHRGKKHRLRACRMVESNLTGQAACDFMLGDEPAERFENSGTGKVAYKRRKTSSTSSQLFKGVDFLITGFPASQKSSSIEVGKKIQDHGGVVLSCIPSFSCGDRVEANLKQQPPSPMRHAVVVAPHKVRTLKYLYGCAAGLLIVKPNWIDQCLSANTLLSLQKLKGKGQNGQHQKGLCNGEGETKGCMFSKIAAFVHGQHSYCAKLALLIQHGGGKVFRSMKSLLQPEIKKGALIGIVVAEHPSKLLQAVKETAASARLPIVPGDWIIDSLLDGRLHALPTAAKASGARRVFTSKAGDISQEQVLLTRSRQLKRCASLTMAATESAVASKEDTCVIEPSVSFLGKGAASPVLSRMGISFVLEMARVVNAKKRSSGHVYYKEACINGTIYSAGDIVEIRPESEEEMEPYVAQIESFYAPGHLCTVSTRSAKHESKAERRKPCCLCCRWFYRPSDTGFLCVGSEKEVYLSQQFDDRAPVDSIIRKVKMVLVLEGKVFTNDGEKGWHAPTESSCTAETADYVCRFFYDFRKESLHQLKAAITP